MDVSSLGKISLLEGKEKDETRGEGEITHVNREEIKEAFLEDRVKKEDHPQEVQETVITLLQEIWPLDPETASAEKKDLLVQLWPKEKPQGVTQAMMLAWNTQRYLENLHTARERYNDLLRDQNFLDERLIQWKKRRNNQEHPIIIAFKTFRDLEEHYIIKSNCRYRNILKEVEQEILQYQCPLSNGQDILHLWDDTDNCFQQEILSSLDEKNRFSIGIKDTQKLLKGLFYIKNLPTNFNLGALLMARECFIFCLKISILLKYLLHKLQLHQCHIKKIKEEQQEIIMNKKKELNNLKNIFLKLSYDDKKNNSIDIKNFLIYLKVIGRNLLNEYNEVRKSLEKNIEEEKEAYLNELPLTFEKIKKLIYETGLKMLNFAKTWNNKIRIDENKYYSRLKMGFINANYIIKILEDLFEEKNSSSLSFIQRSKVLEKFSLLNSLIPSQSELKNTFNEFPAYNMGAKLSDANRRSLQAEEDGNFLKGTFARKEIEFLQERFSIRTICNIKNNHLFEKYTMYGAHLFKKIGSFVKSGILEESSEVFFLQKRINALPILSLMVEWEDMTNEGEKFDIFLDLEEAYQYTRRTAPERAIIYRRKINYLETVSLSIMKDLIEGYSIRDIYSASFWFSRILQSINANTEARPSLEAALQQGLPELLQEASQREY